jgi:hypothetical protein
MRGSGFQNGANVTLGQKNGCGHVVDMNTLKVVANRNGFAIRIGDDDSVRVRWKRGRYGLHR